MYNSSYSRLLSSREITNFFVPLRFLRTASRIEKIPKLLKGTVRNVENFQPERIANTRDLIKDMKKTFDIKDENEIEQAILDGDDFTSAVEKCDHFYDMDKSEAKKLKAMVKKRIIERKYFKNEIETNLLTYAAKKQMHYLHQLDPIKWTPEVLAESFPISVLGAKKLLKSKFLHKPAEKIKEHDLKVAERWKILKSGQISNSISVATQRLWKEGKLSENYYSGNPNFPTVSLKKDKVIEVKNEKLGEYSAIIKNYIDYKKDESVLKKKEDIETNMSTKKDNIMHSADEKELKDFTKNGYYAPEEFDGEMSRKYVSHMKHQQISDSDVQHHQFVQNLKEEVSCQKKKSYAGKEYQNWIKHQDTSQRLGSEGNPYNVKEFFSVISKYEKDALKLKQDKSAKDAYMFDSKMGYQHPHEKYFKTKINIAKRKHRKGYAYKVGRSVYDDDGELLYKLPSCTF